VRDFPGAFGPLKPVAGSLCFILDSYKEYDLLPAHSICDAYCCSSERGVNEHARESLAPRIKTLSELLSVSISPGDIDEEERSNKLGR